MKFTPESLFSSDQDVEGAAELAQAIDGILDTVVPAAMLQWSKARGTDVVLVSDLGDSPRLGRRVFVSEMRAAG